MGGVAGLLVLVIQLYILIILIRVILGWLSPYPTNPVTRFFWQVTEPVLAPIRRRLPFMGGFDLSPLVVWVVAIILINVLNGFRA
jgi:YggT family protein